MEAERHSDDRFESHLCNPLDHREPQIPLRGDPVHPTGGLGQSFCPHLVSTFTTLPPARHESDRVKHREVLDNGLTTDRQLAGQRRSRRVSVQ